MSTPIIDNALSDDFTPLSRTKVDALCALIDEEPLWLDFDPESETYTEVWPCPFLPYEHYEADVLGHPYSTLDDGLVSHSGHPFSQEEWIEWITPKVITPSPFDEVPF